MLVRVVNWDVLSIRLPVDVYLFSTATMSYEYLTLRRGNVQICAINKTTKAAEASNDLTII